MKVGVGGFPVLVFIVLLVLKLTGVIAWSWWWVTSPVWISILLTLLVAGVVLTFLKIKIRK